MKILSIAISVLSLITTQAVIAEDKLDMQGISIVGNSELPKSLYIVPWKQTQQAASAGKPVNSLVDELLMPVERATFQRKLKYFSPGKAR